MAGIQGTHPLLIAGLYLCAGLFAHSHASSQPFTTIINVPSDPAPTSIGSDTQLNLFDGGVLGPLFGVGAQDGSSFNVELNVFGGRMEASTIAYSGSIVNIQGGDITSIVVNDGGTVNIAGGKYQTSDSLTTRLGSVINITGNEFFLDGVPVAGLDVLGTSVGIDMTTSSYLTVTLADGTLQTFINDRFRRISDGTINLISAPVPAAQSVFNVPSEPAPHGLRIGQTLNLGEGGVLEKGFTAVGSTVNIDGGVVNSVLTADTGSVVNLNSGSVTRINPLAGSTVNISGGSSGVVLAGAGSTVNMSGGRGRPGAGFDSTVNISGGTVPGDILIRSGSVISISGGQVNGDLDFFGGTINLSGGYVAGDVNYILPGGVVNLSGGRIGRIESGGMLNIHGGQFFLDGAEIPGIDNPGDSTGFDIPAGSHLTAVLADGSVKTFDASRGKIFQDGFLTLFRTTLPDAQSVINVPAEPAPFGLRHGQTLNLSDGGFLDPDFTAIGSTVNVDGGVVGIEFNAEADSTINIRSGVVAREFDAWPGSTVNISGGIVGDAFEAHSGSTVNISGGEVGRFFRSNAGSTINISGGKLSSPFSAQSGTVNVIGDEFYVDGVRITGLDAMGDSVAVDYPAGAHLTATFADGSVRTFGFLREISLGGSATLTRGSVPALQGLINVPGEAAPPGLRTGQTLNLDDGGELADEFTAVGSTVNIQGGTVGRDFIAEAGSNIYMTGGVMTNGFYAISGSKLDFSDGLIQGPFEAFSGSTVNMSGGLVGSTYKPFIAHPGSTVNITGGHVDRRFEVFADGDVNISGGQFGPSFILHDDSIVNISGGLFGRGFVTATGSRANFSGAEAFLNGAPIQGLGGLGDTTQINIPDGSRLTLTLADGTVQTLGAFRADSVADGTMHLTLAALPVASGVINVPADPAPHGLRVGQTLNLNDGGELVDNFTTIGSVLNIRGGVVGDEMIAETGSTVHISGGAVGNFFKAFDGSTVTVSGGQVGFALSAFSGSTVNIDGGAVGSFLSASEGSTINISGGQVGEDFEAQSGSTVNISGGVINPDFEARSGSTINVTGGAVLDFFNAFDDSTVNMSNGFLGIHATFKNGSTFNLSGGRVDRFISVRDGAEVNIFAKQIILDGVDITEGMLLDELRLITERDVVLEGLLANGKPFSFELKSTRGFPSNYFDPNATLTVTRVVAPEPGTAAILCLGAVGVLRREGLI